MGRPTDSVAPGAVFAEQLRSTRKRREWTQQKLADELRSIGAPGALADRTIIAKIEAKTRPVSIGEALAIAAALDVCPLHLFVPRDDAQRVEIGTKLRIMPKQVRSWVRGLHPLPEMNEMTFRTEVPETEWWAWKPPQDDAELAERMNAIGFGFRIERVEHPATDPRPGGEEPVRVTAEDLDRLRARKEHRRGEH